MHKSLLINISLIFLIAGLFWLTQRPPVVIETPQLSQINADEITKIHITRPHNNILLEKSTSTNHWQLIQPLQAKANPNRIQFMLDLLDTPVFSQQPDSIDLAPFGLAPPKIQLQLNQYLFEFGEVAPLNKQRYLHYNKQIHLIADRIYPLLLANPSSFIANRLIPEQQRLLTVSWTDINNLTDGNLSQIEGHWTSSDRTLNADQIGSLLTSWQHAQASSLHILDNPPETTGATLSLQLEDDATPTLYSIQLTDKEILLQQHNHRLQYHFPISIKTQIFPSTQIAEPDA